MIEADHFYVVSGRQLFDDGNHDAARPLVNGIKAEGVDVALDACDAAMRSHGALGYSRDAITSRL